GRSAIEKTILNLGWEYVESRIRSMIENGTYMNRMEAYLVDGSEKDRIADQIFYFFRDGMDDMPEDLGIKGNDYPAAKERLVVLLSSGEGRKLLAGEISKAAEKLDRGEASLRWGYVKKPEYLLSEISDLGAERKDYPLADETDVLKEDFITQDEIDAVLSRGSGLSNGKFRIYEYFLEERDTKDNIDFLKKEYGTGGRSDALPGNDRSWEDHDGKGIKLTKGNAAAPYVSITLKWNVVEKRVRELISQDRYLSPKDRNAYLTYRQEQDSEKLEKAQSELETAEEDVRKVFSDKEKNEAIEEKEEPRLKSIVIDLTPREPEPEKKQGNGWSNADNYRITDDSLGAGGPKEKFCRNIDAIRTLQKVEGEGRTATKEEQGILSKYVGWGSLPEAFEENRKGWENEHKELKGILSEDEYASARESTLNAHYTSPLVIRSIYDTIERLGFRTGNILESKVQSMIQFSDCLAA
ncbi:MAG: helicase SNF2, partial [Lachnospiraceae bacterium]|nr:helicase SNF2 [Lachnospiraceae bacterium]